MGIRLNPSDVTVPEEYADNLVRGLLSTACDVVRPALGSQAFARNTKRIPSSERSAVFRTASGEFAGLTSSLDQMPKTITPSPILQGPKQNRNVLPYLIPDRFFLNRSISYFHGLSSFGRVEVPDFVPEDRRHRIQEVISYAGKLTEAFRSPSDQHDLDDALDTALASQLFTDLRLVDAQTSLPELMVILLNKFAQTGFRRDLEEGLRVGHLALTNPDATGEEQGVVLMALGTLLSQRFKFTNEVRDLVGSVELIDKAILVSENHPSRRLECIISRAVTLTVYYCKTKLDNDFRTAIIAVSNAMQEVDHLGLHNSGFLALSNCSAILHGDRFCKEPTLLDWVVLLESGIHIIKDSSSGNLSETFRDADYKTKTLDALERQLARFHVVIEGTDTNPITPTDCNIGTLHILDKTAGRVLAAMWEEYGKRVRKIHPAVALAEIANGITPMRYDRCDPNEPQEKFPSRNELYSFGLTSFQFRSRFMYPIHIPKRKLPDNDFNSLLRRQRDPATAPAVTTEQLRRLASTYGNKFNSSYNLEDLSNAIKFFEAALAGVSVGHAERPGILYELACFCYTKSSMAPSQEAFDKAFHYCVLVLTSSNLTDVCRYSITAAFASVARQRYACTSPLPDLDKAITVTEQAIKQAISANHDRLLIPTSLPYTLGMCLKTRYQNTGEPKNLDDSIKMMELAMLLPNKGREKVKMLVNMGLVLRQRYRRNKDLSDLDRALAMTKEGLNLIKGPAERLSPLNNLVLIFWDRYNGTNDPEDVQEAICYGEEGLMIADAIGVTGGPKGAILLNLANALALTDDPADLDKAVEYGREAADIYSSQTDPQAGGARSDLSEILLMRYHRRGDVEDLNLATQYAEEALGFISKTHPLRGEFLIQLGGCLVQSPDPSPERLERCIQVYQEAWNCTTTLPAKRIGAASEAAKYLLYVDRFLDASEILENAVNLMPELEARWTQRAGQEGTSSLCLALPSNAALVALKAGKTPEHALTLLEAGRGRMMGSLMDFRSDVMASYGGKSSVQLLREFNLLRMRADSTDSDAESRRLKEQMSQMLKNIRQQPGFENFMFPPSAKDYMRVAADGPVVVVSTSELVDPGVAFIITTSDIHALLLPNLKHQEAAYKMHQMSQDIVYGEPETLTSRNKSMLDLLGWLWDTIVEPIFVYLGYLKASVQPAAPLPRIRWVAVGSLAKAPLHAAGNQLTNISATQYAISSYAPSLRALLYATERKQKQYLTQKHEANILIVKMSETEGADPLLNVEAETGTLRNIASTALMRLTMLDSPTATDALKQLPLHNLVHFACHGVSEPSDPAASHLLLSDGKLTVQQLMRAHAAEPDVAFLSACSTAESDDARVVDESIHIASAFLMVGFKQVVATLWSTSDKICMETSNRFYAKLLGDDGSQWDGSWKVAEALHAAVREIQQIAPKRPLMWSSFVVFGA